MNKFHTLWESVLHIILCIMYCIMYVFLITFSISVSAVYSVAILMNDINTRYAVSINLNEYVILGRQLHQFRTAYDWIFLNLFGLFNFNNHSVICRSALFLDYD